MNVAWTTQGEKCCGTLVWVNVTLAVTVLSRLTACQLMIITGVYRVAIRCPAWFAAEPSPGPFLSGWKTHGM